MLHLLHVLFHQLNGEMYMVERETEDCELFGGMLIGDDQDLPPDPLQAVQQPDELGNAEIFSATPAAYGSCSMYQW